VPERRKARAGGPRPLRRTLPRAPAQRGPVAGPPRRRPFSVIRYKTAKYTIERPLQIGAALAGGDGRLLDDLSAFAIPLGEAFQLRDDLLGIFGDPGETGKSRLDDLREGKHTVLVALPLAAADKEQEADLRAILGDQALTEAEAERARRPSCPNPSSTRCAPSRARPPGEPRERWGEAGAARHSRRFGRRLFPNRLNSSDIQAMIGPNQIPLVIASWGLK
jgi:hypothetical protein